MLEYQYQERVKNILFRKNSTSDRCQRACRELVRKPKGGNKLNVFEEHKGQTE